MGYRKYIYLFVHCYYWPQVWLGGSTVPVPPWL